MAPAGQARITAVLALANGKGKPAWQALVRETLASRWEAQLALLSTHVRLPEAAAIARQADRQGIVGTTPAQVLSRRSR